MKKEQGMAIVKKHTCVCTDINCLSNLF